MLGITKGNIGRTLKVADLVLTETYHQPLLRLRPHDHEYANINIVLDGHLDEVVETLGFSCDRYSSLVKPRGAKHSNRYGPQQTHCLIVEFQPKFLEQDVHRHALAEIKFASSPGTRAVAKQIWSEFCGRDPAAPLIIEGLVVQLLGLQLRSSNGRAPGWLERCREILDSDIHHPPSISALSRQLGIDRTHLTRCFAAQFGMSPGAYLRSRRIDQARDLLLRTSTRLSEVALQTGFYDQSHFSRMFAAHVGCTPLEYRRIHQSQTSHKATSVQDAPFFAE